MNENPNPLTAVAYYAWLIENGFLITLDREGWNGHSVSTNCTRIEVPRDCTPLLRLDDRLLGLL